MSYNVPNIADAEKWCKDNNVPVLIRGGQKMCVLYKVVNKSGLSDHSESAKRLYMPNKLKAPFTPLTRLTAPDWKRTSQCGAGIHLSPTPQAAGQYNYSAGRRFFACYVNLKDLVGLGSGSAAKAKCETLRVIQEIDYHSAAGKLAVGKLKEGDQLVPRDRYSYYGRVTRFKHTVKVAKIDDTHVHIIGKNGKPSKMLKKSVGKSYKEVIAAASLKDKSLPRVSATNHQIDLSLVAKVK